MSTKSLITTFSLLFVLLAFAKGQNEPADIMAIGGIKSASTSPFNLFYTPAFVGLEQKTMVGGAFTNGYLIHELSSLYLVATHNTQLGSFSGSLSRYGYSLYNQTTPALGYANKWGAFTGGIRLNCQFTNVVTQPTQSAIYTQIGFNAQLSAKLNSNLSVTNIESSLLDKSELHKTPEMQILWSVGYQMTSTLFLTEIEKTQTTSAQIKFGVMHNINKQIACMVGVKGAPFFASCGIATKIKQTHIVLAFNYNNNLGVSSAISITQCIN